MRWPGSGRASTATATPGADFDLALTVLDVALSLGPAAATDLGAVEEARSTFAELGVAALVSRLDTVMGVASPA